MHKKDVKANAKTYPRAEKQQKMNHRNAQMAVGQNPVIVVLPSLTIGFPMLLVGLIPTIIGRFILAHSQIWKIQTPKH